MITPSSIIVLKFCFLLVCNLSSIVVGVGGFVVDLLVVICATLQPAISYCIASQLNRNRRGDPTPTTAALTAGDYSVEPPNPHNRRPRFGKSTPRHPFPKPELLQLYPRLLTAACCKLLVAMSGLEPTLLLPFAPRQGYTPTAPAIVLPPSSPHTQDSKAPYTISYHHLSRLVGSLQISLASLSLDVGQSVSSSLTNGIEFAIAFLATGAQRLIAAPLNPAYTASEVEFYLSDTRSRILLVTAGSFSAKAPPPTLQAARKLGVRVLEIIFDRTAADGKGAIYLKSEDGVVLPRNSADVRAPQPEDVALILHTSGTTGRPKVVPLTHANMVATMKNIIQTYELTNKDRTFLVMPLFHVHGMQAAFLTTLLSGGAVVIPPKFSASSFWSDLIQTRCTWYTAVPTIHSMLLNTARPPQQPPLRFIRSCSSSLAPSIFHSLENTFGAPVLEAYAMTEAAHQMTSNPLPHRGDRRPGSVGVGQGVEVRIIDQEGKTMMTGQEGEVCVRGKNVTKGYLNNPKANAESFVHQPPANFESNKGFFRTGDQGKLDFQGYLTLTGRIKELINRGGEKISPLEVDAALLALKDVGLAVKEAVSFAVEDATYGQKVGAAVTVDSRDVTPEKIRAALENRLSKFKIPERVWIMDAIPKTATGKIQRRNVAAQLVAQDKPKPKL